MSLYILLFFFIIVPSKALLYDSYLTFFDKSDNKQSIFNIEHKIYYRKDIYSYDELTAHDRDDMQGEYVFDKSVIVKDNREKIQKTYRDNVLYLADRDLDVYTIIQEFLKIINKYELLFDLYIGKINYDIYQDILFNILVEEEGFLTTKKENNMINPDEYDVMNYKNASAFKLHQEIDEKFKSIIIKSKLELEYADIDEVFLYELARYAYDNYDSILSKLQSLQKKIKDIELCIPILCWSGKVSKKDSCLSIYNQFF